MKATPENIVKRSIKDYLSLTGWFWYYNLQGLGAYKGIPDITAIKDGRVLQIEVKAQGGKPTPKQLEFRDKWTSQNGEYIIVKSVDDLIAYLEMTK